ncbi:MAG: 4-(cytidine 5'-diphospho)-2-C-methyl-D-erythritol kinase [Clostridia bacterium]|nr:4-(cytidine 5'-diphospho)-2-C-methyl-D-erythritol kinase [Clostridia bacterium]
MKITANAKINLTLDITGKRPDGYHDLETVMQSISLSDTLTMERIAEPEIKLTCSKEGIPTDSRNTVYKAAEKLLSYAGIKDEGVSIYIEKEVPSEAGLGGGSADAAAALRGIKELFDIEIPDSELYNIARSIGADVPFCLHEGTCLCEGIGEKMTELKPLPDCVILISKPPVGVSTGRAYAETDSHPQLDNFDTPAMLKAIESEDIAEISKAVGNRFDFVLQVPEVQEIKKIMLANGALCSCMSGSGSSVFGIFTDNDTAEKAKQALTAKGENFICKLVNNLQ